MKIQLLINPAQAAQAAFAKTGRMPVYETYTIDAVNEAVNGIQSATAVNSKGEACVVYGQKGQLLKKADKIQGFNSYTDAEKMVARVRPVLEAAGGDIELARLALSFAADTKKASPSTASGNRAPNVIKDLGTEAGK